MKGLPDFCRVAKEWQWTRAYSEADPSRKQDTFKLKIWNLTLFKSLGNLLHPSGVTYALVWTLGIGKYVLIPPGEKNQFAPLLNTFPRFLPADVTHSEASMRVPLEHHLRKSGLNWPFLRDNLNQIGTYLPSHLALQSNNVGGSILPVQEFTLLPGSIVLGSGYT